MFLGGPRALRDGPAPLTLVSLGAPAQPLGGGGELGALTTPCLLLPFRGTPETLCCRKIVGRKSREKKLRTQMRRSGTAPVAVTRRPPGLRKMSEVLVDVAEPLLRGMDPAADPANYEAALLLGAALWNASVPGSPLGSAAEKEKVLAEIRKRSPAGDAPEVEHLCDQVMERARALYPHEARIIAGVHLSWESDRRCHINVASVGSR
jgi:hypothetical protein